MTEVVAEEEMAAEAVAEEETEVAVDVAADAGKSSTLSTITNTQLSYESLHHL